MAVRLSNELWLNVFSFVQCRPTLAAAARCSKQLNSLATPFLYQHVRIGGASKPRASPSVLMGLLAGLIRNPGVASLIKAFSICRPWFTGPQAMLDSSTSLKSIAHSMENPPAIAKMLSLSLHEGHEIAAAFIILQILPNLKTLELPATKWEDNTSEQALYNTHKTVCKVNELKLVGYGSCSSSVKERDLPTFLHTQTFIKLFQPNRLILQDFGSPNHQGDDEFASQMLLSVRMALQWYQRFCTCDLKYMEIRECHMQSGPPLAFLYPFKATQTLETLIYECDSQDASDMPLVECAIAHHKNTLVNLEVDMSMSDEHGVNFLSELPSFLKLEHLKIAATFLLGRSEDSHCPDDGVKSALINRLPPNITTLTIVKAAFRPWNLIEALKLFFSKWETVTPHLEFLKIEGSFSDHELSELSDLASTVNGPGKAGLQTDISVA